VMCESSAMSIVIGPGMRISLSRRRRGCFDAVLRPPWDRILP
jgi:hypothetical protein